MIPLKILESSNRNQNFLKAEKAALGESQCVNKDNCGKDVHPLQHRHEGSSAKGKEN